MALMQGISLIQFEMRVLIGYVSLVDYPFLSLKITRGFCLEENNGFQAG